MITRVMAINPNPSEGRSSDVVVYQVPENSDEFKLLTELLNKAGIEWCCLPSKERGR